MASATQQVASGSVSAHASLQMLDEETAIIETKKSTASLIVEPRNDTKISPHSRVNWISRLFFSWQTPLMRMGRQRPLQEQDLYRLSSDLEAKESCDLLEKHWKNEVAHFNSSIDNKSKRPSLLRVLYCAYGVPWAWAGLLRLTGDLCQTCSPILLELLLKHVDPESGSVQRPAYYGYMLVLGIFLLQFTATLLNSVFFFTTMKVGLRMRTGLVTALYRKSLRLSTRARLEYNSGKVTNIMSTDTTRIDMVTPYMHMLWAAPLQIIIVLGLLVRLLGPPALAGFAFMLAFMPINGLIMKRLSAYRRTTQKITDERVKLINELLQGIKIVKFFAWEEAFLEKVHALRHTELITVRKLANWRSGINGFTQVVPTFAAIIVYVVYGISHELTATVVFSSLALFNLLRLPLMFVPMIISMSVDARVAANRLSDLLQAEELDSQPELVTELPHAIEVTDASFIWETIPIESAKEKLAHNAKIVNHTAGIPSSLSDIPLEPIAGIMLKNINLIVPKGKLIAIVGRVGSGKSSLLSGLVGEMKRTQGTVRICGDLGYCPQQPWIQNATLRDNILFGLPFDADRYNRAIFYASLQRDLETLPAGELTEIGEKGINLSGGQKARINLARAIYFDPDILVMDDVLSAVDAHVGSFLFHSTICGALKGRTRILVTHALHFVPYCDYVVVMNGESIETMGTYQEMLTNSSSFATMMEDYGGIQQKSDKVTSSNDDDNIISNPTITENDVDPTHNNAITYEMHLASKKVKQSEVEDMTGGLVNTPNKIAKDPSTTIAAGQILMTSEERNTGAVASDMYAAYGRAGGGLIMVLLLILLLTFTQGLKVVSDLWLTWWTQDKWRLSLAAYMGIYGGLGVILAIAFVVNGLQFAIIGVTAARNLHAAAIRRVVYSPMSFFDTTPLGRIINRFSKDQDSLDDTLYDSFRMFFITLAGTIATFALIIAVTPIFAAPLVPLIGLYYYAQLFYRSTSRELKRLESNSRSPLFAHFGETLTGVVTIRAYREQERFSRVNQQHADKNNRPYFQQIAAQRWLALRLETVGNLLVFFAGLFGLITLGTASAGLFGLSMSYALQVTGVLNWCVRQAAEVETQMNSVERLDYYATQLENEAPPIIEGNRPDESWPATGHIKIENLEVAYRKGLPPVLFDINLEINGGSKIGIVGRTGAGKSSIIVALLRLVEVSKGRVVIDGVDISKIGLKDLRNRISIIPQDPVLFAGTVRSNLDRFGIYSDDMLWECLARAGLKEYVSSLESKLDAPVTENGENLSVGQRQLMCLARAMAVQAKILIMDEATASVDLETDHLIQQAIRRDFGHATIITVAHRLNTIIDYDKILVLDAGRVKEYDHPAILLERADSLLTALVNETGSNNAALLKQLAKDAKAGNASLELLLSAGTEVKLSE